MKGIVEKLGITPGPWDLGNVGDGIIRKTPHKNRDMILTIVNEQHDDDTYTPFACVVDDRDARLIAAAPEMLEALISDIAMYDVMIEAMPIANEKIIKIRQNRISIITKATGKSWSEIKELLE